MSHAPKIAIIHPDTLAAIGLKHMLQEVMPVVNVDLCRSVWEIPDAEIDDYIHYFASTSAITADLHFFTEHRRKTIVLNSSPEASFPLHGLPLPEHFRSREAACTFIACPRTSRPRRRTQPSTVGNRMQ